MKTIITTCCPYGNLEKIFFILQQAGLKVESDAFGQCYDKIFGPSGTVDKPQIVFALLQGVVAEEDIAGMISEETSSLLPADGRYRRLLDSWAARLPEAKFLLFYTRAESALAFACRQEIEPQQALENWQAASRQLLNFQRCHRRQAILLEMDAAIRQPQAFLDICRRFGLTLESLPKITVPDGDQLILERYLAQQLVAKQPEVQSLQIELEASAQPFDDVPPSEMQILELFNIHSQQLVQQRQLQQQLDATVKKLETAESALKKQDVQRLSLQEGCDQLTIALEEQVHLNSEQQVQLVNVQQIKQELEAAVTEVILKNEQLILQLDQLTKARDEQLLLHSRQQAKLDKEQEARQALDATTKELTQENELLLSQLHQVQEELEKIFQQKQQLEQQTHQLVETVKNEKNEELQQVKDELLHKARELEKLHQRDRKLKQSVSWKITTPIRAIAKPFKKLSKDETEIEEQIKLLRSCELFDAAWYIATNEDVAKDRFDAVEHYVRFGAAEGRDPSPVFSTRRYLKNNPDVAEAGMNPLVHYAQYGMAEKRCIE